MTVEPPKAGEHYREGPIRLKAATFDFGDFSPPVSPDLDTKFEERPDLVEKVTTPEELNQIPPRQKKQILSIKRNVLLQRLETLKSVQPKTLVFDELDIEPESEAVAFERFIFEELPDENKLAPITDPEIEEAFIFAEEPIQSPNIEELSNANIILEAEMNTSDIFKEDRVASPSMVFKDVQVVKEREVTPAEGGQAFTGVVRAGTRSLGLPGKKLMFQSYVEEIGDAELLDDQLQPTESPESSPTAVELIAEEVMEKIKDRSLVQSPKQPTPRVLGPWASKFLNDVEAIEKGAEPTVSPIEAREEEELAAEGAEYRTPSPVRRTRELVEAQQAQYETLQKRLTARRRSQDPDKCLMEPGQLPYEKPKVK